MKLKGKDARYLRGLGHKLKPIVTVGKEGPSDAVLRAIDLAHEHDELFKLKILDGCPYDRREVAAILQEKTDSQVAQVLGRTLLLYRRHPEKPKILLPSERA